MALAQQGLITYDVAIAVLFGANIGTTATGWIAAIGGTADAKRTALSHTLSNVAGSVVLVPFFYVFFVKVGPWLLFEVALAHERHLLQGLVAGEDGRDEHADLQAREVRFLVLGLLDHLLDEAGKRLDERTA